MTDPLAPRILSIQQPWAWAIIAGYKPVENRTWSTKYRGPVLIHAGRSIDRYGIEWLEEEMKIRVPENLVLGAIIGVCTLIDVVTKNEARKFGRWFSGPYGFVFTNPVCLKRPIKHLGKLGLYTANDEIVRRVRRQLNIQRR